MNKKQSFLFWIWKIPFIEKKGLIFAEFELKKVPLLNIKRSFSQAKRKKGILLNNVPFLEKKGLISRFTIHEVHGAVHGSSWTV